MSAPKRWLESEDASREALELLRSGRPPLAMGDAVRRRSRRRVAGLAALPAAAVAFAWWPPLALGAAVGVGTFAALYAFTGGLPPASPTAVEKVAPQGEVRLPPQRATLPAPADGQSSPSGDAAPVVSAQRPIAATTPQASESPRPAPVAAGLEQEIQVLEQARRWLSSDPAQARRVLLEHEQRFAVGQLHIEREFLLIDALVRLGRRSEAEARARVLEGQAPNSLYRERLDQILGRSGEREQVHATDGGS